MSSPGNFAFLAEHSPLLADLGATAERLFPFDPASCVLKLRLLAEAITQDMAARLGISLIQPTQAELLRAVDVRLGLDAQVRQLFHLLRRTGNLAAHEADHGIGYRQAWRRSRSRARSRSGFIAASAAARASSPARSCCRTIRARSCCCCSSRSHS